MESVFCPCEKWALPPLCLTTSVARFADCNTRRVRKVEIHQMCRPIGKFLCVLWQHCRRPWTLPVSSARLTVIQPALFERDVFEMAAPIKSPAKCEVRSVIRTKRMGSALKFLTRYAQEGDEFLDSIVTGDEIWVFTTIMNVRWRWWGARRSHDVVQRAGGRLLWLGDTEAGSKT